MKSLTAKKEKIVFNKLHFAVNATYTSERTGNYEKRNLIAAKWDNTSNKVDGCGNIHGMTQFNVSKQTFEFLNDWHSADEDYIPMYYMMSPSLLLYRLISTFFGTPTCDDNYKSIWEYNLQHKETGKVINFSEWKGAIGFWLPEADHKKLNKNFKSDLIELLNYLVSNECVHPYDNLVAGSIA